MIKLGELKKQSSRAARAGKGSMYTVRTQYVHSMYTVSGHCIWEETTYRNENSWSCWHAPNVSKRNPIFFSLKSLMVDMKDQSTQKSMGKGKREAYYSLPGNHSGLSCASLNKKVHQWALITTSTLPLTSKQPWSKPNHIHRWGC